MRAVRFFLIVGALLVVACGSDSDTDAGSAPASTAAASGAVGNACPAEGCVVTITNVDSSGDGELLVTWETNFDPDVSRNHIHVYWDTYSAEQVSSDAEANGFTQGDWVPTDVFPTYTTEGPTSVGSRADSTTLCVTAADRDHAVIDPSIEQCFDVSEDL